MRTLIRLAACLYPKSWRVRYGDEFDALLDDITPSWWDAVNVLGCAVAMRGRGLIRAGWLSPPFMLEAFQVPTSVLISSAIHMITLSVVVVASWLYLAQVPLHAPTAPSPPPAPHPPVRVTDPRVFRETSIVYSSLPLVFATDGTVMTHVVKGVGLSFPQLPDAGAAQQCGDSARRLRSGQSLEPRIIRRVIPRYPSSGRTEHVPVSIFVEYLIRADGSVKVLRAVGPNVLLDAAREAVETWKYRPAHSESVTRVEVRFDGRLR
jgi:Gram-negative bacterial TonB protein C-terminal